MSDDFEYKHILYELNLTLSLYLFYCCKLALQAISGGIQRVARPNGTVQVRQGPTTKTASTIDLTDEDEARPKHAALSGQNPQSSLATIMKNRQITTQVISKAQVLQARSGQPLPARLPRQIGVLNMIFCDIR